MEDVFRVLAKGLRGKPQGSLFLELGVDCVSLEVQLGVRLVQLAFGVEVFERLVEGLASQVVIVALSHRLFDRMLLVRL